MVAERTCAACDCKLESDPIAVRIGGRTVEVCCEDCAVKLKEAHASAAAQARKGSRAPTLSVLAICIGTALGATPFEAQASDSATKTVEVRYADLDLSTAQGLEALYQRLTRAANRACDQFGVRLSTTTLRRHIACVSKSMTDAVGKVAHPALTARLLSTQSPLRASQATAAPEAAGLVGDPAASASAACRACADR
jgi:UrcA family protein